MIDGQKLVYEAALAGCGTGHHTRQTRAHSRRWSGNREICSSRPSPGGTHAAGKVVWHVNGKVTFLSEAINKRYVASKNTRLPRNKGYGQRYEIFCDTILPV